ncbi:ribonuclease HII [Flavihumibacter rivuli]|uniref:ribonuclease HII n=1 Tax=Flavihumibacter rivuli TaxID=2838156 RepID=UPI001BDEDE35|nr:ribonuclease HII [Flavihumibacter rivuli]ULQ55420.1 ribonuclease HII [Flavihumibacter rivuli]
MAKLKAWYQDQLIEAGCDEAGRGCYAGPVYAAAVILPRKFKHPLLNDSKQLKASQRDELRWVIEEKAVAWAVASVSVEEIDRINILQASFLAMHRALDQLSVKAGLLLIDGNRFKAYKDIPHQCIIKGDATYASIAAASILAKTYRDAWMDQLHDSFPQYDWINNKGYGTPSHRRAIEEFGLCEHHRRSFDIVPKQGKLFL